jgi:ABC-2 type transport system permease protein
MARMRDVIHYEVRKALRKKSFWYSAIAIPLVIIAIFGLSYFSDHQAASKAQNQTIPSSAKMAAYDGSGLVNPAILKQEKIGTEPSQEAGINAVKNNQLDAFFYYPKNVVTTGIYLYEKDQGLTNSPPYSALAQSVLKSSVGEKALKAVHDPELVVLLGQTPNVTTATYKNGIETDGLATIIVPGILAIAFLTLIILLSYMMISTTSEEKSNRVAEIILTSINGRTLILGKIMTIYVLAIVQFVVLIVPLIILYLKFKSQITLPGGISLSQIPINPTQTGLAVVALALGLMMFTGIFVGLGAMFSNAQDASRFLGVIMIWIIVPVYALGSIISSPHALIVTIFTYFPLTAPTTILIRNTLGSITVSQALPSLLILVVCAVLAIMFSIRAFQMSAMEYNRRVTIKELLR